MCCDKSRPASPPVQPPKVEPEDFDVEEFPIEFSLADNCGFRSVRPRVTLYGEAQPYIVGGSETIQHEYPFMVSPDTNLSIVTF